MNLIYEKNLKTLAKYFPDMDKLIEDARKNLKEELEILEETAYDGQTILKIVKDKKTYYLNGKRNTTEPAEMWRKGMGELVQNAPVFMAGIGNDTYLKDLADNTKNHITIVIYEPSLQIFLRFLEHTDIERWMEKHLIIFWVEGIQGMDLDKLGEVLGPILKYELMPFSRNLILPNYEALFPEKTVEFIRKIYDIAKSNRIGFNTRNVFSGVSVKNYLNNLMYTVHGYRTTQLVDVIPEDIPGIVVAAGPSLNKNIRELKKAKGKAFIIAVDTAVKPLLKEGIIPDMFAIVDGEKPLSLVEQEEAKKIPLFCTLVSASEILNYHTGMKIFFNEGFSYAERIYARADVPFGMIPTGGSVATNAFSLLYKIGIKRIILVGQDLALTGNKTHADGTFQEKMDQVDTTGYKMVEGNYEKEVPTRGDFLNYLEWYHDRVKGCKERIEGFHVINATEGGAKIKETEIMTLKDAIERECKKEVNIQECLQKMKPMLDEEKQKWAKEMIENIPEDLKGLGGKAVKARKLYGKLDKVCKKRNIDAKEYLNVLKKIEKTVTDIEQSPAYELVEMTLLNAQFILKNEQFLVEDSLQAEGREIARKGILYTESIKKCADLFENMMKDILEEKRYIWDSEEN